METSIFVSLLKNLCQGYYYFRYRLDETYQNSQTYIKINEITSKIKTVSKFSFLGRMTEIKYGENSALLNEGIVIRWFKDMYKKWKIKFNTYLIENKTDNTIKQLKNNIFISPVKIISIIIIVAIFTNTLFSIWLKKDIMIFGWIMRGLFLFVGIVGLKSHADWPNLKSNSLFLRLILKNNVRNMRNS